MCWAGMMVKIPADIAYMPLLQFYVGELYVGAFQIGTLRKPSV